jgi:hypothetical protein
MRHFDVGWRAIGIVLCFLARAVAAEDGKNLVLEFEPRSTRLTSDDSIGLDQFTATLEAQPDHHLIVLVPWPKDGATRRFVQSRLMSVQRALSRRGVVGETVKIAQPEEGDEHIVLWIAPRDLPHTPIEVLSEATSSSPTPTQILSFGSDDVPSTPTTLLPVDGEKVEVKSGKDMDMAIIGLADKDRDETHSPVRSDIDVRELWIASTGQSLRTVLVDWAKRAGWTIVWQSDREYPVDAMATFSGDFMKAAEQLFEGFSTAVPAPSAHFYKGNNVLLVESGEGR